MKLPAADVLIACENSGRVRDAFTAAGVRAMSCDLLPSATPGLHHQGDVIAFLRNVPRGYFKLIIAHPECTAMTVSGNAHYAKGKKWYRKRLAALAWTDGFWLLACEKAEHVCFENPVSVLATQSLFMPKPVYIQPYDFGDDASKKTALFLYRLPPLKVQASQRRKGRMVEWPPGSGNVVERWSNQCDSGQSNLGPFEGRGLVRSETYHGIACAFVRNWRRFCSAAAT